MNISLSNCKSQIKICKFNESELFSKLKECEAKVNNLEISIETLFNNIFSLQKENSKCKSDLNDYKTKYDNLEYNYTILKKNYDNLNNKYETNIKACQSDYNSCKNQLSYYINLSSQITSLKEKISSLSQENKQCYDNLNKCYNNCPVIGYDSLNDQMKQTFHELVVFSFQNYKYCPDRAKYISDRMSQMYNKNSWSCIIGKASSYWGYYVWHVNSIYYSYRYKNFDWVIFIGHY